MRFTFLTACLALTACATNSASEVLPSDATVSTGKIASRDYLTTVTASAATSNAPSLGVGGGGGSGIGGGGFLGAGLSLDISTLFAKRSDQSVKVYRYQIELQDGGTRQIDSILDLPTGTCVNAIDSKQPGYPRLKSSGAC